MFVARRGMSLPEILVTCALAILLLGGFVAFLLPTLGLVARGTSQTEAQQQGVLALERIERELRTSGSTAVGVFGQSLVGPVESPGLYLTPLADVDGQGQPNWAPRMLAFYWDRAGQRLLMKSWPPKPPASFAQGPVLSRPARLTVTDFRDWVTSSNGSEHSLASGVTQFDVLHAGSGSALVAPLTLQIELQRQEGHHREQFKFRKVFTLRTL